jgi:serine/threonine protein kinase
MRQGRILAGKYRLVSKLTEGGMGMVWRAEHVELGSPAAVKLLDPTIAESAEALARFKREAQSAASLRCTNIVQIFDFGVDETLPYIAMELLRGKSLAEKLRAERQISPTDTAAILSQVARAVSWAHSRGIVHRDLKPGNIFLSEDADDIVVKLLDFGIAKPMQMDLSETPVTLTGAIMGTPQYMSPEQASGKKLVDHRTDIWSYAIVAFECLTGRHAFRADTLGGLVLAICTEPLPKPSDFAQVPPGFDEWFAQAAHRNAAERFSTIAEASDTLRFVCGVESTGSNRISTYDGTLQAEVRSIATPSRGSPLLPSDTGRTSSDTPSITTLTSILPRTRRAQVLWLLGVLAVAVTAVGSIMHFGSSRAEATVASATATGQPATPTGSVGSSALIASPASSIVPSDVATKTPPESLPSTAPTMGKPTRGKKQPIVALPSTQSPAASANPAPSSTNLAGPASMALAATNCDPEMKKKLGFCPPAGKK